jgi:cysteine synthase
MQASNASEFCGIYGAEIIETDAMNGTDGAQIKAKELVKNFPVKYFYADQYNNEANWRAHYEQSAPKSGEQTTGESRILSLVSEQAGLSSEQAEN